MQGKFKELLAFIQELLSRLSEEKLALFRDFLKETGIEEKEVEKAKIDDEEFKDVLKSLEYDRKVKDAVAQTEPPAHIKEHISKTIKEAKAKVKEFFEPHNPDKKTLIIKDRFDHSFLVTVSREFFEKDPRILPSEENTYEFEIGCYYRKEMKRLEVTLYSQLAIVEKEIPSVRTDNFIIFDKFAGYLGLGGSDKSVQFSAVISDGEISYSYDCDAFWTKHIPME